MVEADGRGGRDCLSTRLQQTRKKAADAEVSEEVVALRTRLNACAARTSCKSRAALKSQAAMAAAQEYHGHDTPPFSHS